MCDKHLLLEPYAKRDKILRNFIQINIGKTGRHRHGLNLVTLQQTRTQPPDT